MHSRDYVKFLATCSSRGPLNAKRNLRYVTKETVKSSSDSWRVTVAPIAQKTVDSHVGRASKDAGRKYANLHAYPGARFLIQPGCLTARFTHLRHEETHGSLVPSLSLFLFSGIISIRDHKWNLSRLSRVTIGQSPRTKTSRVSLRAHTYAPSHRSHQLSFNSLRVSPLYPPSFLSSRGVPANGPATGYRFWRASWSGTFRPASSRASPLPLSRRD